jgi:hypothetical protein
MQVQHSSSLSNTATSQAKESQQSFAQMIQKLSMPDDVKEAFIGALNAIDPQKRLMALSLTLDPAKLSAQLNGTSYTPTQMDYTYLQKSVDAMLNPKNGAYTSPEAKENIQEFWSAFENIYNANNTQGTPFEEEEEDLAVLKFLEDLRTKGAVKFLAEFNEEKIKKMVEEFRQKLLEKMGDSPEALKQIEELVAAYKKQLLEELQNSLDADGNTRPINADAMVQTLLDAQTKQKKPLEELLASS